jgi:hypothetical protein
MSSNEFAAATGISTAGYFVFAYPLRPMLALHTLKWPLATRSSFSIVMGVVLRAALG